MDKKLKELKIKRDPKIGVGKKMGYQIWIHKDYVSDILTSEEYNKFKKELPSEFEFDVLRWDDKNQELGFISSPDFDTANEPLVGLIQKVKNNNGVYELGKPQNPPKDPLIYHHKWTFVKDDYKGFDVEESKKRTIEWKTKLGIDKATSSRIGRLSFWNNWLKENGIMERKNETMGLDSFLTQKEEEVSNKMPPVWQIYNEISLETRLEAEQQDASPEPIFLTLPDGSKVEQKIPSARTARLQRPKTIQIIKDAKLFKGEPKLLDVGCGSGNAYFKGDMEDLGVNYNGCDLYNQPKETNLSTIKSCMNGGADIVTLNNVLNTIAERDVRKSVLEQCKNGLNGELGIALILTYEGEKNSAEKKWEKENNQKISELTPTPTRDGWQNRMKTDKYLEEISEVFPNVKLVSMSGAKVIVASNNPELDLDLKKRVEKKSKLKNR